MEIPGQALEKAAGEVATEASKTLFAALGRRLNALSARYSAHDEATAEEIKKNIQSAGDAERQLQSDEARRLRELKEIEHQIAARELFARGVQRYKEQIEDEQKRVEWVGGRAVQIAGRDDDREQAREIPDDWLKRFFKYVADVDDEDILELLARCLSDAAFPKRTILSPKALDTLRFFEHSTYEMFKFCAFSITLIEAVPADYLENRVNKLKLTFGSRDFDLALMIELGLVIEDRRKYYTIRLGTAYLTFSYDAGDNSEFRLYRLTYVGRSIASLIDRRLGRLESLLRSLDTSLEVGSLQQGLGFDNSSVTTLVRCLISQMADSAPTDLNVKKYDSGARDDLFSCTRKNNHAEFSIPHDLPNAFDDSLTSELMRVFETEFRDFDKNQLPNMFERPPN